MHIVHIITGLNNGGAEGVLYRLCLHDTRNTHSIISLMDEGKYGNLLKKSKINVYYLNMNHSHIKIFPILKLLYILKNLKPDIIQTWLYHSDLLGGLAAALLGYRNIFWNIRHTSLDETLTKKTTIYVAKACAALSNFIPKKIICCAYKSASYHSKFGYQSQKLAVISNGYEIDKYDIPLDLSLSLMKEYKLNGQDNIIGMVARFNKLKDHENLLQAASIVKQSGINFKLVLVGPDIDKNNFTINKWINQYNLQNEVLLLGPKDNIPVIMSILDIHVLSSSSEGFPNVICEAMLCKTPCISTDVGDAAYIIAEHGWVVPPKNSSALAKAIIESLRIKNEEPLLWKTIQHNCYERISKNFSMQSMVLKYNDIWNS